jgi:hypothetical protein
MTKEEPYWVRDHREHQQRESTPTEVNQSRPPAAMGTHNKVVAAIRLGAVRHGDLWR